VNTNRTIFNNKLDIINRNNGKGKCPLMDIIISRYRNMIKRVAEKVLKRKYFTIAIQRVWNVKAIAIPSIIRTTGTIPKSLRKHPKNISERHK